MAGKSAPITRTTEASNDLTASDDAGSFNLAFAPGHLLRRNDQRATEIFQKHVGSSLTRQQFALLVALREKGGAAQKDLVDFTGIDKSTTKEMLGRMVARGWVERQRCADDRRAWTMSLTPEGVRVLSENKHKATLAQSEILKPLTPEQRRTFIAYLRLLLEAPAEE